MSPALLICAMGVCVTAVVGVMVGACMVADLIVRWIDGRRHGPLTRPAARSGRHGPLRRPQGSLPLVRAAERPGWLAQRAPVITRPPHPDLP